MNAIASFMVQAGDSKSVPIFASFLPFPHHEMAHITSTPSLKQADRHKLQLRINNSLHLLCGTSVMAAVALERCHAGCICTGLRTILFTCCSHTATTGMSTFFRRIRHKSSTKKVQFCRVGYSFRTSGCLANDCSRSNSQHGAGSSRSASRRSASAQSLWSAPRLPSVESQSGSVHASRSFR